MSDDLARELLDRTVERPLRIVYGVATGDNTVAVRGAETAVAMPALTPVKSGDYCAVLEAGADRLILGPVDKSDARILLSRDTAMSIGNGGGGTTITWGTSEAYVSHVGGTFKAGSADVITIPAGLGGDYLVAFSGEFAVNATGVRQLWVTIGSNSAAGELSDLFATRPAQGTLPDRLALTGAVRLDAGSTLTAKAYQNSGGALNLSNMRLSAIRLGS